MRRPAPRTGRPRWRRRPVDSRVRCPRRRTAAAPRAIPSGPRTTVVSPRCCATFRQHTWPRRGQPGPAFQGPPQAAHVGKAAGLRHPRQRQRVVPHQGQHRAPALVVQQPRVGQARGVQAAAQRAFAEVDRTRSMKRMVGGDCSLPRMARTITCSTWDRSPTEVRRSVSSRSHKVETTSSARAGIGRLVIHQPVGRLLEPHRQSNTWRNGASAPGGRARVKSTAIGRNDGRRRTGPHTRHGREGADGGKTQDLAVRRPRRRRRRTGASARHAGSNA